MKKITIIALSFLLFASGFSQAQKVKYPTRKGIVQEATMIMDKNGKPKKKPLAGVRIFIKAVESNSNDVVSNSSKADGEFTLTPSKVPFKITQVKKNEYTLLSPEQGTRTYQDNNEILDVLMVSTKTLNKYNEAQIEIARIAREKEKTKALKELQKKKDDGDISYGEYFQKEDSINQSYKEKMERMIDYIERSSKEFFKGMEQIDKQIDDCIIKGEIDKADSLIISKGYFNERIVNIEKLDETKLKLVEDAVSDCLKKHEISKDKIKYSEALAYLDTAKVLQEKYFGLQSTDLATIYNNIGTIYEVKGNLDESMKMHNKALSIRMQVLDSLSPDLAQSYSNLGVLYHAKGDLDEALKMFNKALSIEENVLNPLNLSLSQSYSNIGCVYHSKGDLNAALKMHNKALSIKEQVLDSLSPDLAISYNNIGAVYEAKDDLDAALKMHNKALSIRMQVLDSLSPELAVSYGNIGVIYQAKGDNNSALKMHNKALSIFEQILDSLSPNLAIMYSNIAVVYQAKGDYDKSLKMLNKTLSIFEQILDSLSPNLAIIYSNIGVVYQAKGDYDKSLKMHDKALLIFEQVLDSLSPNLVTTYDNVGGVYLETKKYNEALKYFNKALPGFIKNYGEEHERTKKLKERIEECKQALGE